MKIVYYKFVREIGPRRWSQDSRDGSLFGQGDLIVVVVGVDYVDGVVVVDGFVDDDDHVAVVVVVDDNVSVVVDDDASVYVLIVVDDDDVVGVIVVVGGDDNVGDVIYVVKETIIRRSNKMAQFAFLFTGLCIAFIAF